jgi:hypothetical protein
MEWETQQSSISNTHVLLLVTFLKVVTFSSCRSVLTAYVGPSTVSRSWTHSIYYCDRKMSMEIIRVGPAIWILYPYRRVYLNREPNRKFIHLRQRLLSVIIDCLPRTFSLLAPK